jgi:hypothetical protein
MLVFGRRHTDFADYSTAVPAVLPLDDRIKLISDVLHPAARASSTSRSARRQAKFAKKSKKSSPSFAVNDLVMIQDTLRRNKMEPPWVGPYKILRKNRGGAYIIQDSTGALFPRNVTTSQMKKITDDQFGTDHVEVDCVLHHRGTGSSREYLVQWKGRDVLTWEPVSHFDDLAPIDTYFRRLSNNLGEGDGTIDTHRWNH